MINYYECINFEVYNFSKIIILDRGGMSSDILTPLTVLAEGLLSLIVYCCNNRAVFRLSIGAIMVRNSCFNLKHCSKICNVFSNFCHFLQIYIVLFWMKYV